MRKARLDPVLYFKNPPAADLADRTSNKSRKPKTMKKLLSNHQYLLSPISVQSTQGEAPGENTSLKKPKPTHTSLNTLTLFTDTQISMHIDKVSDFGKFSGD